MVWFTMTREDIPVFLPLLPKDVAGAVGRPGFFTIGALQEPADPAGVLQFYVGGPSDRGASAELTYLYVAEEYRGSNVATELLSRMRSALKAGGIERSEIFLPKRAAAEDLKAFLSACDYRFSEDGAAYCLAPLTQYLDRGGRSLQASSHCHPMGELSEEELRKLLDAIWNHSPRGTVLAELSRDPGSWEKNISGFYRESDGCGVFLIRKLPSGLLEPVLLHAYGQEVQKRLQGLIAGSMRWAEEHYSPDTLVRVRFRLLNTEKLLAKLCPKVVPERLQIGILMI